MEIVNKKFITDYSYALGFSIVGIIACIVVYSLLNSLQVEIKFGGDKGNILFGIFIGMPLGNISGLIFAARRHREKVSVFGIILAAAVNLIGNIFALFIMDKIGSAIFPIAYLLIIFISIAVYRVISNAAKSK